MSAAEVLSEHWPEDDGTTLRDLLRRCGATSDRGERAALLTRVASELDQAAREIAASDADPGADSRELVAALQGQACMARFVAELERNDWARHMSRGSVVSL
jgi:hypothetical protein